MFRMLALYLIWARGLIKHQHAGSLSGYGGYDKRDWKLEDKTRCGFTGKHQTFGVIWKISQGNHGKYSVIFMQSIDENNTFMNKHNALKPELF